MSAPIFGNRQNPCLKVEGRDIWHSRSVAVVASVIARAGGRHHVALLERGPALPDEVGKLALPGGYLDWDETVYDAARREVFEEVGLDVQHWEGPRTPWRIHDEPLGRQNVTMHFWFALDATDLPALSPARAAPGEVARALWLPAADAMARDLAFGHQRVLKMLQEHLGRPF